MAVATFVEQVQVDKDAELVDSMPVDNKPVVADVASCAADEGAAVALAAVDLAHATNVVVVAVVVAGGAHAVDERNVAASEAGAGVGQPVVEDGAGADMDEEHGDNAREAQWAVVEDEVVAAAVAAVADAVVVGLVEDDGQDMTDVDVGDAHNVMDVALAEDDEVDAMDAA